MRSSSSLIRTTSCTNGAVIGLTARRIGLPHQLLRQEPESLADPVGGALVEGGAASGDVRPESVQLLGHIQPLGEDSDLLGHALLVDGDAVGQDTHRLA